MLINSSSSLNATHPASGYFIVCFISSAGTLIFCIYTVTNFLLLLPLNIFVLREWLQRWQQQQPSHLKTSSHTDVFTYNMVMLEFFNLLGSFLYSSANLMRNEEVIRIGFYLFSLIIPTQNSFHCLTCIERYLAVVHPIIYLGLKTTSGIRIRNISICCVWLMGFAWMGVTHMHLPDLAVFPFFCLFCVSLLVSSFCSLSVLWALKRPIPGENGEDRERVNQSKKRAFRTLMIIVGVLLLRFVGLLICLAVYNYLLSIDGDSCIALQSSFWFNLPSSLVLPLLYLYRVQKLPFFKK